MKRKKADRIQAGAVRTAGSGAGRTCAVEPVTATRSSCGGNVAGGRQSAERREPGPAVVKNAAGENFDYGRRHPRQQAVQIRNGSSSGTSNPVVGSGRN